MVDRDFHEHTSGKIKSVENHKRSFIFTKTWSQAASLYLKITASQIDPGKLSKSTSSTQNGDSARTTRNRYNINVDNSVTNYGIDDNYNRIVNENKL